MHICDKIMKVDDSFTVKLVDNGYVFEMSGQDDQENWKTVRIVCTNRDELDRLIDEAVALDRNE